MPIAIDVIPSGGSILGNVSPERLEEMNKSLFKPC